MGMKKMFCVSKKKVTCFKDMGMMMVTCALLVASALAQHEPRDDSLDAMLTPMHGEACGYASCLPIKPGWLNVHIVPQTHSELGHVFNFEQHFTGEEKPYASNVMSMKKILDAIVTQLWEDERRKFTLSDTAYLFHWWSKRHPTVHRMVYELIRQGRLTLVGGGLGISDEASTSYHAIIDQFTYSLRRLNTTFRACARPLVAWAVDVYGHSREFTSLMAQMGYDALFINPISYDEEMARMRRKALEFVWRGSDDLGAATDIFAHNLFDGYWAPPGFCFSKLCSDPLLVTSNRNFRNIEDRVDKFIEAVLYRQAPNYETRNIMVIMGHRKAYFDADVWFANIEKLISFTNWRAHRKGLNVTLFYSNPACYLSAVHDENPELETKQDDFFPYVHDKDSYTVGMYTSRPNFKYLIREAHIYLQILKQMQVTANIRDDALLDDFNWIMGIVQDHSIATGVVRLPVKQYYVAKLDEAIVKSTGFMSTAFKKLRASLDLSYHRCQFNVSSCEGTRFIRHSIQVYNPLGWPVTMPVRLPIQLMNSKYRVYDAKGAEVPSETINIPDTVLEVKGRKAADHELVFIANNLPPVGFRSYYIEAQITRGKRNIKNSVKHMPKEGSGAVDEDTDATTAQNVIENIIRTRDTNPRRSSKRHKKNQIKIRGLDPEETEETEVEDSFVVPDQELRMSNAPRSLATVVLKNPKNNNNANTVIHLKKRIKTKSLESTTEAELIMLPMLRDYLNRENILRKLNFVDSESEFKSDELFKDPTEFPFESDIEPDIEVHKTDTRRNDDRLPFEPTREPDLMIPKRKEAMEPDIMVPIRTTIEPDIRVMKRTKFAPDIRIPNRVTTHEPDILVPVQIDNDIKIPLRAKPSKLGVRQKNTESLIRPFISTTDSDIRVPTMESDIKVQIENLKPSMRVIGKAIEQETDENDIEVSRSDENDIEISKSKHQRPVRMSTEPEPIRTTTSYSPTTTESLSIVPVRTKSEPATAAANWHKPASSIESVLVVPVIKTTEASPELPTTETASTTVLYEHDITEQEEMDEEEDISTTESANTSKSKTLNDYNKTRSDDDDVDKDDIVSNEIIDNSTMFKPKFRATTKELNASIVAKDPSTTDEKPSTETDVSKQNITVNVSTTTIKYINLKTEAPVQTTPVIRTNTEKYFKVNGGGQLFIGNKYVRVNLDRQQRVASVFLSNGIRVSLNIKMFHYVSDNPAKFDIRTVPRRDIKPPGAYIFRPIDPYIINMDGDYEAEIVKTSVVEEIRIVYNYWASVVIRLYVDSPVIEVHWLVGPIPTADGLGRDVFIRYATDLVHDGAFYTDSNGRQTIKRIRNTRATYEPLDLDPIAGNLYPVTSKISIEDVSNNVRFSVFNDRCQAGGALVDGAIDLMVHRRILTDDIGFGAYLNESDSDGEGIMAAGTHYLYITRADKNRVFEKKFAKEIAMAPRVLVSDPLAYSDNMKGEFYACKNEFSALKNKLPLGVHLLTFEIIGDNELLVRLENYLEKADVKNNGDKYVALRNMFTDVRIIWLKETTLAANMFKEQWSPTQWRNKNKFVRNFNEYYGGGNVTYEDTVETVKDELGGRGIRLSPQQIRTFIVKYEYTESRAQTTKPST